MPCITAFISCYGSVSYTHLTLPTRSLVGSEMCIRDRKNVEYSDLKRSEKFTPALYQEKDGVWEGGSVSQFTPVMTFRLWERFSETCLEVSESMEVNGKKTFGYDVPVIYKRI